MLIKNIVYYTITDSCSKLQYLDCYITLMLLYINIITLMLNIVIQYVHVHLLGGLFSI